MNGHERWKQRLIEHIQGSALELFSQQGVVNVSMDQVAARAGVSKVTIYKYFHSKEELQRRVADIYIDQAIQAVEKVLDSDQPFIEKLKFALAIKVTAPKMAPNQAFFDMVENDRDGDGHPSKIQARIKEVLSRFFEQGKKEGYFEPNTPFELVYLYSEIFQAGSKIMAAEHPEIFENPESLEKLLHFYFYGLLKPRPSG